jgi:O-antigen/teichoic acid export membrane protein
MTRPILLVSGARAVSLALGLFLLGVLGRRLGPTGFGSLQFALAVMAYPILLVDLGLTTLGLREIARGGHSADVIGRVLAARLALSFAVLFLVAIGLVVLPLDPTSKGAFAVLALSVPISAVNARWVLQGEQRFGRGALVEILTTGTQLVAVVALVGGTNDVLPAAVALTFGGFVAAALSIALAGGWRRFRPGVSREVRTTILRSLPLGAAAIAITIYYGIDTILLGIFRGSTDVAYYAAAYRIILPILALAGAASSVAIPHLSMLVARDPSAARESAVRLSQRLVFLALPMAAGGALAAKPIIETVYGPDFAPAEVPFRILVFSVLTVYSNAAFAFLLLAREADRRYLVTTIIGATLNIGVNLVAIPAAGMVGAAGTTMLSELAVLALIIWWTREISVSALIRGTKAAGVPTLVMCATVWPVRDSIAAVPVGIFIYCLAAALTRAIPVKSMTAWRPRANT